MRAEHSISTPPERNPPGQALLLQVRAGFVAKGTSLRAWCLANGVKPQNARLCLFGCWDGPAGRAMRERICVAALG